MSEKIAKVKEDFPFQSDIESLKYSLPTQNKVNSQIFFKSHFSDIMSERKIQNKERSKNLVDDNEESKMNLDLKSKNELLESLIENINKNLKDFTDKSKILEKKSEDELNSTQRICFEENSKLKKINLKLEEELRNAKSKVLVNENAIEKIIKWESHRNKTNLKKVFFIKWRALKNEKKFDSKLVNISFKYLKLKKLKKFFWHWKNTSQNNSRISLQKRMELINLENLKKQELFYLNKINFLENKILNLQFELKSETERNFKEKEELKKTFFKSVSKLNLEALSAFNNNAVNKTNDYSFTNMKSGEQTTSKTYSEFNQYALSSSNNNKFNNDTLIYNDTKQNLTNACLKQKKGVISPNHVNFGPTSNSIHEKQKVLVKRHHF
ncbi:hypothetical protein HDU92_003227 [Lobulomyces angularis]|nr:hypothetical protein HDU92_003227 [Lobulomyces angularis]